MNKAVAQLTDLFRSMTPGARITAGLLLAVVVISVAYLFNSSISGPDAYLLGGRSFDDNEMKHILVAFGEAGLNHWKQEGMQIKVPHAQQDLYLAAMAKANALPQDFRSAFEELLQADNMLTPDRRWQDHRAIAEMKLLTQIIEEMPGFDRANVMIKEDKSSGLRRTPKRSANVIVFPEGGHEISSSDADALRQLVCGSCGIEPEQISIVDGKTRKVIAKLGSTTTGSGGNELFQAKTGWENEYADKVRKSLSFMGDVVVTAEVQVKPEMKSVAESVKIDKQNSTPIQTSEQTSASTSQAGGPGGQPGLEANSPVPNGTAAVQVGPQRQTSTTDDTSRTETVFNTPFTKTTTQSSGFEIEMVKVAVSVPMTYFAAIWQAANPPAAGAAATPPSDADLAPIIAAETKKIKAQVAGTLPAPPAGMAAEDLVTVNTFASLPAQEPPAASFLDGALGWLSQSWTTVALFMLAAFGLMTMRGLTKSIPVVEAPTSAATGAPALAIAPETTEDGGAAAEPGGKGAPSAPRLKRRGVSGPSLREELSEIVKEDPDAAANVLRAWIGSAT